MRHRQEDNSHVRYLNQFEPLPTEIEYLKSLKTEEERLRAVISSDFSEHLPEYELTIASGLRKGSMYGLTWEMVDWNGWMLHIPPAKTGNPCMFH